MSKQSKRYKFVNRLVIGSKILVLLVILSTILTAGCTKKSNPNKITIADQYGLAYAPVQVMKDMKILEKNLPGVEISWRQLGNTAAIREAMLVNEVDVGFMAIPPFLIGWDKGMDWKIATGLSSSPVGLVVNKPEIKSIKDFSENDRIAVPQPGSVQHILLAMACERVFGDAKKLDNQLVTMAHPDGMNAFLSKKDVTAHFTSPPYLIKELEQAGTSIILSGDEAIGKQFTFIVGVTTDEFYNKNQIAYTAFIKSLNEAMEFINNNPDKAAAMLSKVYDMSEEDLIKQLTFKGNEYSEIVRGVDVFAEFMKRNGYISKTSSKNEEIMWDDVKYE